MQLDTLFYVLLLLNGQKLIRNDTAFLSLAVYVSSAPPPPVNCSSVPVYNEEGTLISINFSWAQVDVSMHNNIIGIMHNTVNPTGSMHT